MTFRILFFIILKKMGLYGIKSTFLSSVIASLALRLFGV